MKSNPKKNKTKIIFFGTHKFAATILEALCKEPTIEVALVVTQPDRPAGREQETQKPPVKMLAEKCGIQIEQPQSLKTYNLKPKTYHLGITAQYGGLIPEHILDAPTHGILNVHTSLLPQYRGASPIQTAIMNGNTETGVTIMKMDEGLDTGPILSQKKLLIGSDETYPEVEAKLAQLGAKVLLDAIPKYLNGTLKPQPQDETKATACKQLTRDDGRIDWHRSASDIYNQYRGLTPWPGVWTIWQNKRLKLLRLKPAEISLPPGQAKTDNGRCLIGAGQGALEALDLQLEGKKPMTAEIFLLGHKEFATSILE